MSNDPATVARISRSSPNDPRPKSLDIGQFAANYFPDRVDAKCKLDLSLAVAHGCFWKVSHRPRLRLGAARGSPPEGVRAGPESP